MPAVRGWSASYVDAPSGHFASCPVPLSARIPLPQAYWQLLLAEYRKLQVGCNTPRALPPLPAVHCLLWYAR